MDKKDAKQRILELTESLNFYSKKYYIDDDPEISDNQYDILLKELISLEKEFPEFKMPNSPTVRIGSEPISDFKKVKHLVPMMSLSNAFDEKEFLDFHSRVVKGLDSNEVSYSFEPKFDGIAVSLIYENSILVRSVTRGDGITGEDITENIKTIKTVPLKLSKHIEGIFEVRGEVIISKKNFKKLNLEREKNKEPLFANPRNSAGGSLRQLNSKITATRPLEIYIYGIGETNIFFNSIPEMFKELEVLGFRISKLNKYNLSAEQVNQEYQNLQKRRKLLPFEIDGAVVKVQDYSNHIILGFTSKYPKWAIAMKFPAQEETTKILDITVQVGRTGILTPVAELEPVQVSGVIIRRATLHNMDEIERKDIRIGDTVFVQRSGDVIPKIIKVVTSKRTGEEKEFKMPLLCPSCNQKVFKDDEMSAYRCLNISCPAQLKERISHFCSKTAFNIEGLGDKIIEQLVEKNIVKDFTDIFNLTKEQLFLLDKIKEKSAENLLNSINSSKKKTLDVFIYSLGIRNVGKHISELLASKFKTLENLSSASIEEILSIDGAGEEIANSIVSFFKNETNKKSIKALFDSGIEILQEEKNESDKLKNKTFVVTGKIEGFSRTEMENLIKKHGGSVSSSVSKNTDFLVAGENAGSKLAKAEKLKIEILTPEDFFSKMEEEK